MTFDELKDGTIKDTIFNIKVFLNKKIPEFVNFSSLQITEHSTYSEAVFQLQDQGLIENFANIIEKKLSLNIMFAGTRNQGADVILVAYSKPVINDMYVLLISSEEHGLFDHLCFRVYDSIEIMLYDLNCERNRLSTWKVLESQDYKDMLNIFIH